MLKSLLGKFGKHVAYVLIAAIAAHELGLATLAAAYIPSNALSSVGVTINPMVVSTSIITGIVNSLEHLVNGGK